MIYLNTLQLLTAKPAVYLVKIVTLHHLTRSHLNALGVQVNITAKNFETQKNAFMKDIIGWVKTNSPGSPVIPFSVTWEQEYVGKSPEDQKEFLKGKKMFSMLPRIIQSGYKAMNLINFFTSGSDEVRSWTIKKNTKAPGAAGVIHGDLEKGLLLLRLFNYVVMRLCHTARFLPLIGFKHAEIYNYDAFKEHKVESLTSGKSTEEAVQKAGKKRQQGKEYIVQNGDVCFFVSTMSRGKKK